MSDLQTLLHSVDELTPAELDALHHYVEKRRQQIWWRISPDKLAEIDELMRPVQEEAAQIPEAETNAAIDAAIASSSSFGDHPRPEQGSR
jgi:hypothetical protein